MITTILRQTILSIVCGLMAMTLFAEPATFDIDPRHMASYEFLLD